MAAPSPRASIFTRSAAPSPRRAPPAFNPAFTTAAGVTKDPEAFDRPRRTVALTYKAGEHRVQFFVRRAPPPPRGSARAALGAGPEYTPRGHYVGDWEADTATLSTRGWSSKRWGVGTQVFPDGSRYEGSWFDDRQNGEGKLFVRRGGSGSGSGGTPRKGAAPQPLVLAYSGSWYNGRMHGQGKQTCPNGDVYEGTFYGGVRQGEGRCLYADGTVYSGSWAGDVRSGLGECVLPSGDSYYGMWEAGERHGQGAFVYRAKGRIYEGEWVRGVPRAGEVRDFAAADDSEGGSGGGAAATARLQQQPQRPAPLPPLQLLDPQGVLRGACLAASGRLGGAGEGGGGGGAGDEGGSGGGRACTRGSAETYYSEGFSEGLTGSYASGSRPGTADAAGAGAGAGGGGSGVGGALDIDPGLTRENLEVLAAAFTAVDVHNTGFIPADAGALAYILHQLSIETPSEQDLAGLLEELVAQTQAMGGGGGGGGDGQAQGSLVSFHAFVAAMGKVKE